jgi:hypothetical protein
VAEFKKLNYAPSQLRLSEKVSEDAPMYPNVVEGLERIKNVLYRNTYLDVLVNVRELREKLESDTLPSVEDMVSLLREFSGLPLPKELNLRAQEAERALSESIELVL